MCIYAHLFCFAKKYTWAALSGAESLDSAQLTVRDSVCTRICVCVHSRILLPSVDFMPHWLHLSAQRGERRRNSMWSYYKPFLNTENSPLMMHFQGGAKLDPFGVKTINRKFLTPALKATTDQLTAWKSAESPITLAQTPSRLEDFHAVTFRKGWIMAVQSPDSTYLHTYSVFFLGRNAGHVSHQNITPQEALFFFCISTWKE